MTHSETKLPLGALTALALTGFICIMTETLPAGLLPLISNDMGIPLASSGQLVTAYALGSLFLAIPLTIVTRSWQRQNVLLATVLGFTVFNAVTALSYNLTLTYLSRFLAGCCAGLAWSLIAGYARAIVPSHQQGKAMAIAMAGTPVALSVGVPTGTFIGHLLGWRLTFGLMSVSSFVLLFWIFYAAPKVAGQSEKARLPFRTVFNIKGVKPVLAVVLLWMLSHNILYTYIAPFITPAGLQEHTDTVLFVFGIASLAGIILTGRLVDSYLRTLTLASLFIFFVVSFVLVYLYQNPMVVFLSVGLWGLTFGGAAILLNTALADAAGKWTDVAMSLTVVSWNAAISLGGLLGGVLLQFYGMSILPVVLTVLIATALIIVKLNDTHAFPAKH